MMHYHGWISPVWILLIFTQEVQDVTSFSASNLGIGLDRFQVTCPADSTSIQQFDPNLVKSADGIWAAVYRSNQNQPSVFVRDEFFHAMKEATNVGTSSSESINTWADKLQTPMALERPVAVAQLRPSSDLKKTWILDSLQCTLKKEEIDENCDGGSEFLEALSVGIDSLVLYHLKVQQQEKSPAIFDRSIRTKATLFCHRLLEARGFRPVETLSQDMATHVASLDGCLEKYAERSVDTRLNSGARDRALQIVSWLARMDRSNAPSQNDDDNDEGYDPWANIKMQL